MAQDFLSQDEVDALLKGVAGDAEVPAEAAPADGVRGYDLGRQERIVRGRMPTLETIHERFTRLLRIGLHGFMRRTADITVGAVRTLPYSEFVRNLVVPTNLNVVQLKPLRGNALFVFDPALIFTVVDNLFGGDGRFHTRVEGRDFTATEQRIIQRMLSVVLEDYRKAWAPVHPIQFDYLRSEMHTQFASIASADEVVVVSSFQIELGAGGGELHICIPYASIGPIRDQLYSNLQGGQVETDQRWSRLLAQQVQGADVDLSAQLTRIPLKVRDLLGLKVGDVIDFDLPRAVVAEVDGVPIFECRYGNVNGQYAIKVDKVLAASSRENSMGDEHV